MKVFFRKLSSILVAHDADGENGHLRVKSKFVGLSEYVGGPPESGVSGLVELADEDVA